MLGERNAKMKANTEPENAIIRRVAPLPQILNSNGLSHITLHVTASFDSSIQPSTLKIMSASAFRRSGLEMVQACIVGDDAAVLQFLEGGTPVNSVDHSGLTLLHVCAEHGNTSLMHRVLQFKPNTSARTLDGHSPLHTAALNGQSDAAIMLLGALPPPNINFQDNSGRTALHWASELGHTSIVRALIAAQPPPNLDLLNKVHF
jgi:ankyrin repeat protein